MNSFKFKLAFSDGSGNIMPYREIVYPEQAALTLNPYPDLELRKKQELTLIWFDTNINFDDNQTQELRKRLRSLNRYVLFYSNFDSLSRYLEASQFENIILITVEDSIALVSSKWHDDKHISRFHLINFDHLNSLLQHIDNHIAEIFENRRVSGQLILDTALNKSQRDVRNESFRILYYRMYKQILFNHDQCDDDKAKSELMTLCRNRYPDQYRDKIKEFEDGYRSENAIVWYTMDSFVYRLINRALRTQDLDCLYVLRFYVRDLTRCLSRKWTEWRNHFHLGNVVRLYRGQVVPHSVRCELENNKDKIVSINGYWSTSQNEQIARIYGSIGLVPAELNHESILFEIEVDLNGSEQILADISEFSQIPNEEEVLFDMDATFHIENIIEEQENQISYWRVRMTLAKDSGMDCIQQSIDQRQLYDSTGFDLMWSVKPDINPFDTILRLNNSCNYLHRLEYETLELPKTIEVKQDDAAFMNYIQGARMILCVARQSPQEIELQKILCQATMHLTLSEHLFELNDHYEFIRWPQRALGLLHFKTGNYNHAIKQWTRIWSENAPHDRFDTVVCCFYLGLTYSKMQQYSTAIDFFKQALIHVDGLSTVFKAQCHMQIGHAIELQAIQMPQCFELARQEYEKTLDLYENHIIPTDEVALALCYAVIGNCYYFVTRWTDESHRYYLKSIDVYDAMFLIESPSASFTQQVRHLLIGVLFHIALDYYQQLYLIDQAQQNFQRIINYPVEHCPFDSYALAHQYLGEIFFRYHKQYEQALNYFHKSTQFYETYTPENYWELAIGHQWLAKTYVKLGAYQNALDHANKIIDFLTRSDVFKPLTNLPGNDLSDLKRVTCFQQDNQETTKKQKQNQTLSETYRLLGDIYEQMQDMDLALAMYTCAFDINQHFTPIYQLETVITENRLKDLYLKTGQQEEAIIQFKNALNHLKYLYKNMYG